MRGTRPTILFFSPAGRKVPDFLAHWVEGKGLTILPVPEPHEVEQRVLRSLPALVVIDADGGPQGLQLCTRLKADSYSAIVPLAVLTSRHTTDRVQEWFTAGNDGDRVIYILSRILHDVVKGMLGARGFIGHIGGDDFICVIPVDAIPDVCGEVLEVFDTLIPYQYNEQDRRAGYYFGKDRRGQLHRVPLMTLSIGIVTNQHRRFAHPAQVSELATEMKSYAKTQPGSVFVVDRRHDPELDDEAGAR